MSNLALAANYAPEPEEAQRARVWVIVPNAAPYPLDPPPFDRDRTASLHKQAGPAEARNGRILSARLPQSRRWQVDTSPAAVCLVTRLTYGEQRAMIDDTTPAAAKGVTPLQAAQHYGVPYRQVYAAFSGRNEQRVRIGERDHFDCWHAAHGDLELVFGEVAKQRAAQATTPEHMSRSAQRFARRRIRTYREGK